MIYIFFILGFLPIIQELIRLYDTEKVILLRNEIQNNTFDKLSNEAITLVLINLFYLIWNIIGFFTNQWLIFLIMFSLGLIKKTTVFTIKLDAIITLTLILFAILNELHFKIDLLKIIIG